MKTVKGGSDGFKDFRNLFLLPLWQGLNTSMQCCHLCMDGLQVLNKPIFAHKLCKVAAGHWLAFSHDEIFEDFSTFTPAAPKTFSRKKLLLSV
ncbi:MAG TPA: hypothetical protein V6C91_00975 [Coleofasciculaceae cyanobacterium]